MCLPPQIPQARPGWATLGQAWLGAAGLAGAGEACSGPARLGKVRQAWNGVVRLVSVAHGVVRYGRWGEATCGLATIGSVRYGRRGEFWQRPEGRGRAWFGTAGVFRIVGASRGEAGDARRGEVRHRMARGVRRGLAGTAG